MTVHPSLNVYWMWIRVMVMVRFSVVLVIWVVVGL